MVGIIDLGTGNLFSVIKSCERSSVSFSIITKPEDVSEHNVIILPGVGAFPTATRNLAASGMSVAVKKFVDEGKLLIGICLGMQLLMDSSVEHGYSEGLGLISGTVKELPDGAHLRRPNIGWNEIYMRDNCDSSYVDKTYNGKDFYFAHSYYCEVENQKNVIACFDFGVHKIPAIISNNKNVIGVQFHPEISGQSGVNMFSELVTNI